MNDSEIIVIDDIIDLDYQEQIKNKKSSVVSDKVVIHNTSCIFSWLLCCMI